MLKHKKKMFMIQFIVFILLSFGFLAAQENMINLGHEITLQSEVLGEDRVMSIYLPDDYDESDQHYPVLYVLDGNAHFHHASGAVRFLSNIGEMPQMIVVAIQNIDRNRDFSPEHVENMPTTGGANKFLAFIAEELIPEIDKLYRTSSYNTLIGHSFGGVFVSYTLLEKPELFDAFIAISPFLQYADNYMVNETKAKLKAVYPDPIYFYMTLGAEPAYLEALSGFASIIEERADPNFHFDYVTLETENHNTIPYISIFKGLRFVFSDWLVPNAVIAEGLNAIDAHYVKISKKYGVDTTAPENLLNIVGYTYLQNEDFENAITVFKANTKRYPDSPNVYDSLGEAYETNGQMNLAKKNYKKAYDLGVEQNDRQTELFKMNYERVK